MATAGQAEAAEHASTAGLMYQAVKNMTFDHSLASAFGDLFDNPLEAGARHAVLMRETVPAHDGAAYLRLSDDGPGLQSLAHLRDAYSFGASPEKGSEHNYGQVRAAHDDVSADLSARSSLPPLSSHRCPRSVVVVVFGVWSHLLMG